MHIVTPTGICLVSNNLSFWANLQSQSIAYNRKRNLILIFLWWPLRFLNHSAAFWVSRSFCVLLAVMYFGFHLRVFFSDLAVVAALTQPGFIDGLCVTA